MNRYTVKFWAACPANGQAIDYVLVIEHDEMIRVEELTAFTAGIKSGWHEGIADTLHIAFGGRQVLKAHHHGVDIETVRE